MSRKIALLLIIMCTIALSACAETKLCVLDVGKGDAIIVKTDEIAMLVDAGYVYRAGVINAAMEKMGIDKFDIALLTHTDSDHADGFVWLAQSGIQVDRYIASEFYACKEKKHPFNKLGIEWETVKAGDVLFDGCTVLAPLSISDEENDNSIVLRIENEDGSILLTGDMEHPEETELMFTSANLKCDILKVANHGDEDASGEAFISAAAPSVAIISSDPFEAPDKPSETVLANLINAGAEIYATYTHGSIFFTLDKGNILAECVDFSALSSPAEIIISTDAKADIITLTNAGGAAADLDGWYLYSERGGELLVLHDVSVNAGSSITIGSLSAESPCDVTWAEKRVLHKKKSDKITLYDKYGNARAESE